MPEMYIPEHFAMSDDDVRDVLQHLGAADLVTPTATGLVSTFMPMLYDEGVGEHGAMDGHFALLNEHWRAEPTGESLVIVHGSDSYITPTWYASHGEHGRVVPTWNHLTIHLRGELSVQHDLDWLRSHVTALSEHLSSRSPRPGRWATLRSVSSMVSCVRSRGCGYASPRSRPRPSTARTGLQPTAQESSKDCDRSATWMAPALSHTSVPAGEIRPKWSYAR